jgi:hypothetical protein
MCRPGDAADKDAVDKKGGSNSGQADRWNRRRSRSNLATRKLGYANATDCNATIDTHSGRQKTKNDMAYQAGSFLVGPYYTAVTTPRFCRSICDGGHTGLLHGNALVRIEAGSVGTGAAPPG